MSHLFAEAGLPPEAPETYIGDGVYAKCDGRNIVLATERSGGAIHWMMLEPSAMQELNQFYKLWTEAP